MRKFLYLLSISIFISVTGCEPDKASTKKPKINCRLLLDKNKVVNGDLVNFRISSSKEGISKVEYSIDGELVKREKDFKIEGLTLGRHQLEGSLDFNDGTSCSKSIFLEVISDIAPVEMTYEKVRTYDHDITSYTQGLEFNNDLMYEGTGQYGASFIHNYKVDDAKSILRKDLTREFFGEGITIFKDKLYQITYHEQVAFVYDLATLEVVQEFGYQNMGWGLTHDDTHIIMSNGSHELVFRNPENFEIVKQISVYDNNGRVASLNELEYVDGFIYANIYQSNFIVKIDAETGKVLEKIDCLGILNVNDITSKVDVLNGIAYNNSSNTFFITGKLWPKMFEVNFVESTE